VALAVGRANRDGGDQHDERHERDQADGAVPDTQAARMHASSGWLAQPVRDRRAERPGDDVGGPERDDRVQVEAPPSDRGDRDRGSEQDDRHGVAEVQLPGREVARRRSERERAEHRDPVEGLAALRGDAVDREGALAPVPDREHEGDTGGVERRRDRVGRVQPEPDAIGDHRAEHRDHHHGEPVHGSAIGASPELQPHRHAQAEQADRAGERDADVREEVRH
jgi:hypothetical protein